MDVLVGLMLVLAFIGTLDWRKIFHRSRSETDEDKKMR